MGWGGREEFRDSRIFDGVNNCKDPDTVRKNEGIKNLKWNLQWKRYIQLLGSHG